MQISILFIIKVINPTSIHLRLCYINYFSFAITVTRLYSQKKQNHKYLNIKTLTPEKAGLYLHSAKHFSHLTKYKKNTIDIFSKNFF